MWYIRSLSSLSIVCWVIHGQNTLGELIKYHNLYWLNFYRYCDCSIGVIWIHNCMIPLYKYTDYSSKFLSCV